MLGAREWMFLCRVSVARRVAALLSGIRHIFPCIFSTGWYRLYLHTGLALLAIAHQTSVINSISSFLCI